jgi:hypothetical protein
MGRKYILTFCVFVFIGCNENKKSMEKPFIERRLNYYVFDKKSEEVIGEIDKMNTSDLEFLQTGLDAAKTDSSSKYYKYFSMYNQPFNFLTDVANKVDFLRRQLQADKDKASKGIIVSSSTYKKLYLNKKYGIFFKDEWYLNPVLFFSEDFYASFFSDDMELLMNHYQYESDSTGEFSKYHLPVSRLLSDDDPEIIQPHEIDKGKASYLLGKVRSKRPSSNAVSQYEYDLFTKMLEGVTKGQYIVVVYNYSVP